MGHSNEQEQPVAATGVADISGTARRKVDDAPRVTSAQFARVTNAALKWPGAVQLSTHVGLPTLEFAHGGEGLESDVKQTRMGAETP